MNGLLEDTRDFLRESAMLGRGAPAQRLFQVVGDIRANENSLTIRHLSRPLFQRIVYSLVKLWNVLCPAKWNRSISRILFPDLRFEI